MKNQYVGDINDYRKYGLLRALQRPAPLDLLVAWMLTPDDGGNDGAPRRYLEQPGRWRGYDPPLYDELGTFLGKAKPEVSLIERSSLLPNASYYCAPVPDGRTGRGTWRQGLLQAVRGRDLVFLDPDNGIVPPAFRPGRKGSSRYVGWQEIGAIWNEGCSILIYQHWRREAREAMAKRLVAALQEHTGAPYVQALRTAHVLFLLVAQERHEPVLREAIASALPAWRGQIDTMEALGW